MRALILRNDSAAAVASSRALIDKGFHILCVDTRDVAETLVRMETIDLLVMDEKVAGQLTHTIALSGERKNPYISSILMTDRTGAETDDLYELIPSLYALAGTETNTSLVGKLALAAVIDTQQAQARVAENEAADMAEAMECDEFIPADITLPQPASLAEDEQDIPSYADVIFATPALAEMAIAAADFDDDDADDENMPFGPDLPDLAAIFAKRPLLLSDPVAGSVPV